MISSDSNYRYLLGVLIARPLRELGVTGAGVADAPLSTRSGAGIDLCLFVTLRGALRPL